MPKYFFKVKSSITLEDKSTQNFFLIEAIDDTSKKIIPENILIELDGNVESGDVIELSVTRKIDNNLYFLHHYDRKNQGDVLSGVYNYYDFKDYGKISWDENIIKNNSIKLGDNYSVIMGGGIYFADNKPRLKNIVKNSKFFIGWGIGLDKRSNIQEFVNSFSLLGTRERNSQFIDNNTVFYVPCVSCMNPFFDEYLKPDVRDNNTNSIAIHLNHGFNENLIRAKFPTQKITYTTTPFIETMENISKAECIITNSYHGAYWGALMGKKIVCLATEVPKWDGLPKSIIFTDVKNLETAIEKAKPVLIDYFLECRRLNNDFYSKVIKLVNSDDLS